MIALDFTSLYIHAVNGRASGGRIVIDRADSAPLPGYISSDGAMDKNATAQALKALLGSGFKGSDVTVVMSKSNTVSNEYVLPYEKNPIAMQNIVRGELLQSQAVDDSVMDYTILEVFPREGSMFCRVQAYLAKRSLVEAVAEVISLAGKKPHCFTVSQNCLYQLHHLGKGFAEGDIIATCIGGSRVHTTLLAQPNIVLTRTDSAMPGEQAFAAVKSHTYNRSAATETATENISKMLQYQSIKYPGRTVNSIFIFGDVASREAAREISASLGLTVSLLPKPDAVLAPDGFVFDQYAYATGALLEK